MARSGSVLECSSLTYDELGDDFPASNPSNVGERRGVDVDDDDPP